MRRRRAHRFASPTALALLLACASCAPGTPHEARPTHTPDPSIPKCSGDASPGCITAPTCQYDEQHQCQMCICSPAFQTPAQAQSEAFGHP